jgi:hypothetical protein
MKGIIPATSPQYPGGSGNEEIERLRAIIAKQAAALYPVQQEVIAEIDELERQLGNSLAEDLSTYPDEDAERERHHRWVLRDEIEQRRERLRELAYDGSY